MTAPQRQPIRLTQPQVVDATGAPLSINQAHGVAVSAVPTQTWLFVADGTNGVRAVNVSTLFDPFRGRVGQPAAPISADHAALTLESRDPRWCRAIRRSPSISLPTITFATRGSGARAGSRLVARPHRRRERPAPARLVEPRATSCRAPRWTRHARHRHSVGVARPRNSRSPRKTIRNSDGFRAAPSSTSPRDEWSSTMKSSIAWLC